MNVKILISVYIYLPILIDDLFLWAAKSIYKHTPDIGFQHLADLIIENHSFGISRSSECQQRRCSHPLKSARSEWVVCAPFFCFSPRRPVGLFLGSKQSKLIFVWWSVARKTEKRKKAFIKSPREAGLPPRRSSVVYFVSVRWEERSCHRVYTRDTRRSRYFAGKFDLFLCGRSLNFADSYLVVKRYAIKHEQVSQSNIYFFDSKVLILIYVFSFKNSATLQISLSLRGRIIFGKTFLFSEISSYLKESGALDNSEKYPAFPTVCLSIGLLAG